MTDLIRLLPDSVANQIAAGEVIQRPASVVKELMENALDAGATSIQLIIKDAGKTLIQVVDNGCGMSESDARMAFERHATSKISRAEDLFVIRSMGFRGEALASIAAVAQVEMKTRRPEMETGSQLVIEGSKFQGQEPSACQAGTAFVVKNLFYNIPARRNFLKSNASETRHIVEEFHRIALARPETSLTMFHDGFEVYRLHRGNMRQRIMGIYGNSYNERLVPVQEETTILNLSGFVLKPEFARKTRGEQYFFVNNRYIKNSYLHHAVTDAFNALLPNNSYPSYFLFIEIDPARIDINIHPTKTEIKFDDEKSVYAIIRAAVKRSLGKFSIAPSLDFDQETAFSIPISQYSTTPKLPSIQVTPGYNPFRETDSPQPQSKQQQWSRLNEIISQKDTTTRLPLIIPNENAEATCKVLGQLHRNYIIGIMNQSLVIIDQQAAHQRILYEKNSRLLGETPSTSQQELFPQTITFTPDDFVLLTEILPDINKLGFDLREFGKNTVVLNGVPAGIEKGTEKEILEQVLESYKNNNQQFRNNHRENLLRCIATGLAVKSGKELSMREMQHLADELFDCSEPAFDPSGKPVFTTISSTEIEKKLQRS